MRIRFKFRESANPGEREQVLDGLPADAERLFPDEADPELAALYVARSAPDGYTLFMSTNSPHSAAPFLMKNVGYDALKDFAAVTRMGSYTLVLCVHPDIPATSVKELIAYARANPGKLSFASGNTSGVVAGETLKHWAELDLLHVPYKSVPPALNDVIGEHRSRLAGLPREGTLPVSALTTTQRFLTGTGFRAVSWPKDAVVRLLQTALLTPLDRPTLEEFRVRRG